MRKPWLIVLGVVLAAFGVLFTLQGLGYVRGSAMSGVTLWAVVGPIMVLAGIGAAVFGIGANRRL